MWVWEIYPAPCYAVIMGGMAYVFVMFLQFFCWLFVSIWSSLYFFVFFLLCFYYKGIDCFFFGVILPFLWHICFFFFIFCVCVLVYYLFNFFSLYIVFNGSYVWCFYWTFKTFVAEISFWTSFGYCVLRQLCVCDHANPAKILSAGFSLDRLS